MATSVASALKIILPKRRANEKGVAQTSTFDAGATNTALSAPAYREHLTDLFTTRQSQDSRDLLQDLFKHDSDVSAAVNAYLTVADTEPQFFVRDMEGQIDREGHKMLNELIVGLTTRFDYSTGFELKQSLRSIAESMRYMLLLRGGVGAELVMNKQLIPREVRHIDLKSVEWYEQQPGQYKPRQTSDTSNQDIDLNIANFFVKFFRRDPTKIYPYSHFVSAINTIAARQQVINDLYRIMQKTGYPRIDISVAEEVLRKNAPADAQTDERLMREWINARMAEIRTAVTNLGPDQAFVHADAVESNIMNQGGPSKSMDVTAVMDVLNGQNQAALKTMATVIGRGESGVNTASVEATVFAKNAEELNQPIAELFAEMFTLAMRVQGFQGYVECQFKKVELRPETELEPQLVAKQARHLELLSHGLIDDDEFHVRMFGRPRPDSIPEMSGTGFMGGSGPEVDTGSISPNSDPQGRAVTPPNSGAARDNRNKK